MQTTLLILLTILVAMLCLKWVLIVLTLPLMAMAVPFQQQRRKGALWWKLMAAPNYVIERLMRGGWQRYVLFQVATLPSVHIRQFIYRMLGAQVKEKVVFHVGTEIRGITNLIVGGGSIIGDFALLDARRGLKLGRNVNLSSHVQIYTDQHNHRQPDFSSDFGDRKMSVEIGDRVWLGSNVIVLPGVTIGEGAVCCAGCVVTKDVPPYAVVAGIPARQVSERPRGLTYEFDGRSCRLY